MKILGIDIGGSGIKGAPVDLDTGEIIDEVFRIPTPDGAMPSDVSEAIYEIVKHFNWKETVGCGFPATIRNGIVATAANIDKNWIGINAADLFRKKTGCQTFVLNDADAAGIAEITFGAAAEMQKGVVLVITVGTGLGTAVFLDGKLLPNTEFGHIEIRGEIAEHRASDAARKNEDLSWKKWSKRFNEYLLKMESLIWPDLIIIGGGVSKKFDKFSSRLKLKTKVSPAKLLNTAGIIGAAVSAKEINI